MRVFEGWIAASAALGSTPDFLIIVGSARFWPKSAAPQAGGVWTGTLRMSPASSPAASRPAGLRVQIPSLHSPRTPPWQPSPSRTSPMRALLWGETEASGGGAQEQASPIAVFTRAANARGLASDETSRSTPSTPLGMALSIHISVPVPRYPLEGRVSTPAPHAWRRRRARCFVGRAASSLEQTRDDRSYSLPERPTELASPLPLHGRDRGTSDLGIERSALAATSPSASSRHSISQGNKEEEKASHGAL